MCDFGKYRSFSGKGDLLYCFVSLNAEIKLRLTSKEAYIAYMSTPCTLVRIVQVIWGHCTFSKLPHQHPQAGKASGAPAATNIDVIGVANTIAPSALIEIIAETFHG